jgi:NAD(P)-dependent dehydrogenase (short-subunit alcohol dehydrogenase family)
MNYLIIGANSTIGKHIIKIVCSEDHHCYVCSRTELEIEHPNIHSIKLDLANEEFPLDFIPEKLDGLIYMPGTINLKPFRSLKKEDFLESYEINFLGAVKSIKAAEASLKKSEQASILLFSTVAVQTGMQYHSLVASSKGAIEGLTRTLAAEFAPKIRVNSIALSLTNTKMAERFLSNDSKIEASKERHPLKSIGDPEDIANLSAFLLGHKSKWITGQIITADGGIGSLRIL